MSRMLKINHLGTDTTWGKPRTWITEGDREAVSVFNKSWHSHGSVGQ